MPGPEALLTTVFLLIYLVLPFATWLLFAGRHDPTSRWLFLGISLISFATSLIVIRPYIPLYFGHEFPWTLIIFSWLVNLEVFRRERLNQPIRLGWVWGVSAIWALYLAVISFSGSTTRLGLPSYSAITIVVCSVLFWNLYLLNRSRPSKSLLLMLTAAGLYIVPNVIRLAAYAYTGDQDVMNVFKFGWQANLVSAAVTVAMMAMCSGYWGFTLDKYEGEKRLAQERVDRANEDSARYRQLVQERDHLLVINSRFATISALSSFSAMLIHDVSQPLQTLQLGLEEIRASLSQGATSEEIDRKLHQLEKTSGRAADLVTALRGLMQSGETEIQPVPISQLVAQVADILQSDVLQQRVNIVIKDTLPAGLLIRADRTMLQRTIFNLISNSLNQFQVKGTKEPQIVISLQKEFEGSELGVALQVTDNAGGFSEEILSRVGHPWSSNSPNGLGLALMLVKQMVGIWGGSFGLSNSNQPQREAIVRIWLRLAD